MLEKPIRDKSVPYHFYCDCPLCNGLGNMKGLECPCCEVCLHRSKFVVK